MTRILFVDDDPNVLESLRDALRFKRREWRTCFALGGVQALCELRRERYDVVISDMRMPGLDGAAVLRRVQECQPDAVRIVLSGSTDRDAIALAAGVAHRFLAKPCDLDELAAVLESAGSLGERARTETRRGTAVGATTLPCAPALFTELTALLGDEGSSMEDVARLVARDIAITAKVLQLTNSAFFGRSRRISRIDEAVTYLGLGTLKAVVLSAEVLKAFKPARPIMHFSIEGIERHGALVAGLASSMIPRGGPRDAAFAAGMLHDLGWLVLAFQDPGHLSQLLMTAHNEGVRVEVVERERDTITHAELGGHLLELWGLPDLIVAAVAHHHAPPAPTAPGLDSVSAVHLADALLSERRPDAAPGLVDLDYVEALGLSDQLPAWRELAGSADRE
jgi:HD-like signal output (HDOD) protein